jgi:hypothetical protein
MGTLKNKNLSKWYEVHNLDLFQSNQKAAADDLHSTQGEGAIIDV